MDDSEIIDQAAEVFFRNAITNAAENTLKSLQDLIGIPNDSEIILTPGHKLYEHLNLLVKDYCDILSEQRKENRL